MRLIRVNFVLEFVLEIINLRVSLDYLYNRNQNEIDS